MNGLRFFIRKHAVWAGLLLMFLLTWPIDLASAGVLPFEVPFGVSILVGYGFVFAALGLTTLMHGRIGVVALLKRFLIWRVSLRCYLIALLLLPAVDVLAILLMALVLGRSLSFEYVVAHHIFGPAANLAVLILPYFLFDAFTNGEEIGWRGFLLPRIQGRYKGLTASLILGLIWSAWHLPKFVSHWDPTVFFWFTVDTTAKAILYTWLYNATGGSLLLTTIFHASGNTAGVLLPIPNILSGSEPVEYAIIALLFAAIAMAAVSINGPNLISGEGKRISFWKSRRAVAGLSMSRASLLAEPGDHDDLIGFGL